MAERGIDITGEFPKPWTDEVVRAADVVVTMGCGDACPIFPGKRYLNWDLDDPAGQSLEAVRPIRDEIERRVRELLGELGAVPPAGARTDLRTPGTAETPRQPGMTGSSGGSPGILMDSSSTTITSPAGPISSYTGRAATTGRTAGAGSRRTARPARTRRANYGSGQGCVLDRPSFNPACLVRRPDLLPFLPEVAGGWASAIDCGRGCWGLVHSWGAPPRIPVRCPLMSSEAVLWPKLMPDGHRNARTASVSTVRGQIPPQC